MESRHPSRDQEPHVVPAVETVEELRQLLAGKDELERLIALHEGDPLRFAHRANDWLARCCHLIDLRKLALKSETLAAARMGDLSGIDDLNGFLDNAIEDAARTLLREDVLLAGEDAPIDEPYEPRFRLLLAHLAVEPAQLRRAVVAINELKTVERHVFYHCFVRGNGFGRYAREFGTDALRARELFVRAVKSITRVLDGGEQGDD